jgi:integrase
LRKDISDVWLRSLAPPTSGRLEVWDTRVTGLVLRMTPKGVATWSVRLRTKDGKRTRPKLGTWPAMGISDARKRAHTAIAAIHAGQDPVAEKKAARAARVSRAAEATVTDRLAEWQAAREADKNGPWSLRYASEIRRVCRQAVEPILGKQPLRETTREDWTKLLRKRQASGQGAAAFLYRTVSSFLNYAEAHGWIPAPLLPRKGATTIAPPVPSRERVLTDDELTAVWKASEAEPPKLRAFTRLLILTAARELEVADIAVGELDLEAARWTIPENRAKNGQAITLPLCPLALAELQALWPERQVKPTYRLLGKIAGTGFRGFGKLKIRLDEASGVTDWRWHDLRRTARTGMTRLGVPRDHAEAAINHVSGRTTLERIYDRHDYAPEVIAVLGRWQAHVAELVEANESTSKVVPIRGARRG